MLNVAQGMGPDELRDELDEMLDGELDDTELTDDERELTELMLYVEADDRDEPRELVESLLVLRLSVDWLDELL